MFDPSGSTRKGKGNGKLTAMWTQRVRSAFAEPSIKESRNGCTNIRVLFMD
jgi:hypothetical protein